jgi:antitoxin component YwqK of YwqJK toxin-antitoxin module
MQLFSYGVVAEKKSQKNFDSDGNPIANPPVTISKIGKFYWNDKLEGRVFKSTHFNGGIKGYLLENGKLSATSVFAKRLMSESLNHQTGTLAIPLATLVDKIYLEESICSTLKAYIHMEVVSMIKSKSEATSPDHMKILHDFDSIDGEVKSKLSPTLWMDATQRGGREKETAITTTEKARTTAAAEETKPKVVNYALIKFREKLAYIPSQDSPFTGKAVELHPNKMVRKTMDYKDGKRHGLTTAYYDYENRRMRLQLTYKEGEWNGPSLAWYKNGQKAEERNFKNGKMHGLETTWYENGQKWAEGNWKNGKLMSVEVWKPNGEKCSTSKVLKGNGVVVMYSQDGTTRGSMRWKKGYPQGVYPF